MARRTFGRSRKKAAAAQDVAAETQDKPNLGITPNPRTNLIIADIALRGGGMLLRRSVERGLLGLRYPQDKAKRIVKGRSIKQTLIGTALARVATTSVPGALVIGGGMLARALYDRRRGQAAAVEGEAEVQEMAAKGSKG